MTIRELLLAGFGIVILTGDGGLSEIAQPSCVSKVEWSALPERSGCCSKHGGTCSCEKGECYAATGA